MKSSKNKSWRYWLRVLHRDLGYLMVGVCLIYGISGILLNHMNGKDPSYRTTEESVRLKPDMDVEGLAAAWREEAGLPALKQAMFIDKENIRLMLEGGIGVYNIKRGTADYEVHAKRPFIYWLNRLHYNRIRGWSFMGDFFAGSLIFFAISGLFLVKGKSGLNGRGKWLLLLGLIIPILYVWLS